METGSRLTSRLAIIGTAALALVFVVLVSSARVLVHAQAAAGYLAIASLELSPFALIGGSLLVAATCAPGLTEWSWPSGLRAPWQA